MTIDDMGRVCFQNFKFLGDPHETNCNTNICSGTFFPSSSMEFHEYQGGKRRCHVR